MKTNNFLFIVLTVFLCAQSGFAQTKVIAHRGFWDTKGSAQNSITALEKANEHKLWGSELDAYITADGVAVVNHDDNINGIVIEESTYAQLKDQKLPNGETIPTLEQYLIAGKKMPELKLILEIKSHKRVVNEDKAVQIMTDLVKKHGLEKQVEYIAFSMNVCKELVRRVPGAPIAYLNGDVSPKDLKTLGMTGLDYHRDALKSNPDWIKEAKALGLTINVWTINAPEDMKYFIDEGVDFITTDKPLELKAMLK